jgi:hypothetical protein
MQLRDNADVGPAFFGVQRSHQAGTARSNDDYVVIKSHSLCSISGIKEIAEVRPRRRLPPRRDD